MATDREEEGRARKVVHLVDALDAMLAKIGVDPHSEAAALAVAHLTERQWQTSAKVAGVPLPSLKTRALVGELFRDRPACRERLARMGF